MQVSMSLLDYLAYRMGCGFLSDMHYLQKGERGYLCRILQQISLKTLLYKNGMMR